MRYRWQGRRYRPEEQVANVDPSLIDLTPASQAHADATRAGWAPLLHGQAVSLIGEEVERCRTRSSPLISPTVSDVL
jgi:hypothetical protein